MSTEPLKEAIEKVKNTQTKPTTKEERIVAYSAAHAQLKDLYGQHYRAMNLALEQANALPEGSGPGAFSGQALVAIKDAVQEARKWVVLYYKFHLRRFEFAINELMPGAFPPADDPLESPDGTTLFKAGASLVALAAALSATGPVAAGIATTGSAMMMTSAIIDILD